MEKNISKVKQRILEFANYQGFSKRKIYLDTGIANGVLDKKTGISEDNIEKFLSTYIDVRAEWLITGVGEMTKDRNVTEYKLRTDNNVVNQEIPVYDIEAQAGLVSLFKNQNSTTPIDTLKIPNLPKCDGAIFVTGDSMYPLLKSGDIVAYKEVKDLDNGLFWGEMYLISLDIEGEEYISVKYIQKSDKGEEYIKLVSQNQYHQDKDIHLKYVKAVALVKASVRINSMA